MAFHIWQSGSVCLLFWATMAFFLDEFSMPMHEGLKHLVWVRWDGWVVGEVHHRGLVFVACVGVVVRRDICEWGMGNDRHS